MAFGELLRRLHDQKILVSLRRDRVGGDEIGGYVAALTEELVLIDYVIDHRRNGFTLIALEDVTFAGWATPRQRTAERLVAPLDLEADAPAVADLDLSDWRSAVASLEASGMLVTLCRERSGGQAFLASRTFELTYDLIVGDHAASDGSESSRFAIRVEDLTRIDFGGDFEEGLRRAQVGR